MTGTPAHWPAAEAARAHGPRRHLYPTLIGLLLAVHLTTMLASAVGESREDLDRSAIAMLTLNEEGRMRTYTQRLAKLVALRAGGMSDAETFRRDTASALAMMAANFDLVQQRATQTADDRDDALDGLFAAVRVAVDDLVSAMDPLLACEAPSTDEAIAVNLLADRALLTIERYMGAKSVLARRLIAHRAQRLDLLATATLFFQCLCVAAGLGLAVWAAGLPGSRAATGEWFAEARRPGPDAG